MLEAKIVKNKLVVEIELQDPTPSASGKTLVIASSHGNQTLQNCKVDGQSVTIGLNAYIRNR